MLRIAGRLERARLALRVLLLVGLAGCSEPEGSRDAAARTDSGGWDATVDASEPDSGSVDAAMDGSALDFCAEAPGLEIVPGSTRKVAQLTGEEDRELGTPATNQTFTRFGLAGTDLGSSFVHDGRTWFLFGDSIPTGEGRTNPVCGDAIAWSTDEDASDGVSLEFVTRPDGTFRSPTVPGIDLGCFDVPLDGIGTGGSMYVWFSTDVMGRSVLARSDDDGETFAWVSDTSSLHFINVSVSVVPADPEDGLPDGEGDRLVLFGSGEYRRSAVYLATVPVAQVEETGTMRYFAGTDPGSCAPLWSVSEADAVAIVAEDSACVGELSGRWDPDLGAWMLLYNCDEPRGIHLHVARRPWGRWSDPQILFHPWDDGGYCRFIHAAGEESCDSLSDPGREAEWGGEYGPYVIAPLSGGSPGQTTLHFVMSTWNPYNTVVMRADLRTR